MDIDEHLKEVDYPSNLIKKVTPYLNDITYPHKQRINEVKLKLQHRCFAWYYVYTHGNKTESYRRVYYAYFHYGRRKIMFEKNIPHSTIVGGGQKLFKMAHVQESIKRIRDEIEAKIKLDVPQTLLQQLMIQATYDPAMFIKADGSPAFTDWDQIPFEYRCCIKSIETKQTKWGKETSIEIVDRKEARKELQSIAPGVLSPPKMELIHKTVDGDGKETGINMSKLTDKELMEILKAGAGK